MSYSPWGRKESDTTEPQTHRGINDCIDGWTYWRLKICSYASGRTQIDKAKRHGENDKLILQELISSRWCLSLPGLLSKNRHESGFSRQAVTL